MRKKKPIEICSDDGLELTPQWFESANLMRGDRIIRRERPPLARPKKAVRLRIEADVLDYFRGKGPGWQTRINEALRKAARRPEKPAVSSRLKAARR